MDREKVIKGLQEIVNDKWMMNHADWYVIVCEDALALLKEQEHKDRMFHALEEDWKRIKDLLKEQEAVDPNVSSAEQRCGNCNKVIEMDGWKACPWCGKRIDWKGWWKKNGTRNQDS